MKRQQRFDSGTLDKAERLPNGFLKADAYLTRTGVFPYMNVDGTIRRELRLAEEVFKEDSMKTLELATLTLGHPPPGTPVTALNAKGLSVGTVGQDVRQDEDRLRSTLMVQDNDAVEAMEDGVRQTSCGYHCDLEPNPGVTADGERYDFIQRNIKYNHVALVPRGRAGAEITVRLDSADAAVMVTDEMAALQEKAKNTPATDQPKLDGLFGDKEGTALSNSVAMLMRGKNLDEDAIAKHLDASVVEVSALLHGDSLPTTDQVAALAQFLDIPTQVLHALVPEGSVTERKDSQDRDKGFQETMMKFKLTIDGIEHELESSETAHKILTKHLDTMGALVDEAGKALDTEKARADSAEEKVTTLTKERNDAIDPGFIAAKVAERVSLETHGAAIMGDDFKTDSTDEDIKRSIVLKVSPAAADKIADCSADYLQARFDQAIESHSELREDAEGSGNVVRIAEKGKSSLSNRLDEARKKQADRQDAMWKTPLATSKDTRA